MVFATTFDTWGEPIYSNGDPMQGPGQISEAAKLAMARGIRHFDTQAAMAAEVTLKNPAADFYMVVLNIPGMTFRTNGTGGYTAHGIANFATAAARAAAITTPQENMLSLRADADYIEQYIGSSWVRLVGLSALTPLIPTSVAGSGASLGANGRVTLTAISSLSVNGVNNQSGFTNVFHRLQGDSASAAPTIIARMRASGVDDTSAIYDLIVLQALSAAASVATALAGTSWGMTAGSAGGVLSRVDLDLANAGVAAATIGDSNSIASQNPGTAPAKSLRTLSHRSTAVQDGISFIFSGGTFTGSYRAFGWNDMT